jgi:hypothetical protein
MTHYVRISFALAIALGGGCNGKEKLDRAKVNAIVKKADACPDVTCARAAYDEVGSILAAAGRDKGMAPEDTEVLFAAQKVIDAKIAALKASAAPSAK